MDFPAADDGDEADLDGLTLFQGQSGPVLEIKETHSTDELSHDSTDDAGSSLHHWQTTLSAHLGYPEGTPIHRHVKSYLTPQKGSSAYSSDCDSSDLSQPDVSGYATPSRPHPRDDLITPSHLDAPWHCPQSSVVRVEIPESTLVTPVSCHEPFEPPAPFLSERLAVRTLLSAADELSQDGDNFIEFELEDFAVYCNKPRFEYEMRSLHQMGTKSGHTTLLFSGVLCAGGVKVSVRHVPFESMPIENYGSLSKHTVRGKVWLQSNLNSGRDIYYKLGTPAKEYARFFNPFMWVADLAKHFVDYLKVMRDHNRKVTIYCFRTTFEAWLKKVHKRAPAFVQWLAKHPSKDFRTSIIANIGYLHKEAIGVLDETETYYHTLWDEVWSFKRYKEYPKAQNPPTVVTQYIYDCFEHLPFGDRLEVVPLSGQTQRLRDSLIKTRHLELPAPLHETIKDLSIAGAGRVAAIKPGDTISTHRDDENSGTKWKREVSREALDIDRWFALVQTVNIDRKGRRTFDVIWYYRPVDTLCGLMKYPWNNELFLSDHCSCGEKSKIGEDEILGVHQVDFGGTSTTQAELFCRQTYMNEERRWITLQAKHLHCSHTSSGHSRPKYQPGDTLLLRLDRTSDYSEPCELISRYETESSRLQFRRLLRRSRVDPGCSDARPNELVYSDKIIEANRSQIQDPCYVRYFGPDEELRAPYDRNGVGCFFYITHRQVVDGNGVETYQPLTAVPASLRQSYDPNEEIHKLRGLDLFCGGGNFGRGLEDGGGIEMRWANDYDSKAIHTYMANAQSPEGVRPFLGSIDDLQRLAINGQFSKNVPRIGEVDFISGGSPCPGFSNLTNDKTTLAQRKNQSLVAAFGSFIDLYRPLYGLLENVPGIVQKRANRDQDVFSQLICAVVGLGYQTQFFFLDASSCGSPQRRSRVFLAFATPGYVLPRRPLQTHAHPPITRALRLGSLPNGEAMAEREMPETTPFGFVSAEAATADLPPVYDAKPDICVPFPDHRTSIGMTSSMRTKVKLIPTQPWGMNFAQAWFGPRRAGPGTGVLTVAERAVFPQETQSTLGRSRPNSNAYGRQFPGRLIETIVTTQSPSDAKNGRTLHWRENRVLTIMEARRAQGFRDDEVLLGLPADQYRIMGNSVAREVAVSLGVVFREAWVESSQRSRDDDVEVPVTVGDEVGDEVSTESPVVIISDSDYESSVDPLSNDGADSLPRYSRPAPSSTPATNLSSSSIAMKPRPHNKRPLNSSIVVEILASKLPKLHRGASPGAGAAASKQARDVIVIDDD